MDLVMVYNEFLWVSKHSNYFECMRTLRLIYNIPITKTCLLWTGLHGCSPCLYSSKLLTWEKDLWCRYIENVENTASYVLILQLETTSKLWHLPLCFRNIGTHSQWPTASALQCSRVWILQSLVFSENLSHYSYRDVLSRELDFLQGQLKREPTESRSEQPVWVWSTRPPQG